MDSARQESARWPGPKVSLTCSRRGWPRIICSEKLWQGLRQTRHGRCTNVVVNVDASGTEVQGNQGNADQLGRLIGQAVQAELIKQKRPGGLLTR